MPMCMLSNAEGVSVAKRLTGKSGSGGVGTLSGTSAVSSAGSSTNINRLTQRAAALPITALMAASPVKMGAT